MTGMERGPRTRRSISEPRDGSAAAHVAESMTMPAEVMPGVVRRSNLVDMVHDAIEAAVRCGELQTGGCQFTEAALCRKFNVSRPTVREALIRLRARGTLAYRGNGSSAGGASPGQAWQAIGIPCYRTLTGIADIGVYFEFRRTIEVGAVVQCALHRNASGLAKIETAFHELRAAMECGGASAEADFRFHLAIARASGNAMFVSVMEGLRSHALFAMNLSRQFRHQPERTQHPADIDTEHRMIVEAILDGDEQGAGAAMQAHIGNAAARVFGDADKEWQPKNSAARGNVSVLTSARTTPT